MKALRLTSWLNGPVFEDIPVPSPGSGRVLLLNAAPFKPETQVGQRVEARGLVYRDERDTLLTVSAMKAVGSCQK